MADQADVFDLVVIGSGPGGYVAAIRAAQLGMKTACIEKDPTLGGTCLNVGCIPSKALLESSEKYAEANTEFEAHGIKVSGVELDLDAMMSRKRKVVKQLTGGVAQLFKKNGVERVEGLGRLAGDGKAEVVDADGKVTRTLKAKNILVATGSVVATIPGVEMDGERIVSSTEALEFDAVPEHLVVIGAGVIGLEMGSVWARLGSKVTVLEYMPKLLPSFDDDLSKLAKRIFKKQGLEFSFGVKVNGASVDGDKVNVTYQDGDDEKTVTADRCLVAVGRKPTTHGLQADKAGLKLDDRGRIEVDEHFRTNVDGIWAVGDVIPGPMLAHKAEHEGVAAVELMADLPGHVNYDAIPNVIYTHPEIAGCGKSEQDCKDAGIAYRTGKFPFVANGRAKALNETDGFVKIIAHEETDRILGAQIIGPNAGTLIAELAVAIEFSASSEDIARSIHAHPTLSEVVKEAALDVAGRTINM